MSLDEARLGFGTDAPNFPGGIPPNTFYMLTGDNAYSYSYSGTVLPSLIGDLDTYYIKVTPGHSYAIVAAPSSLFGSPAVSPNVALLDKNGFVLSIGSGGGLTFTATSDSYYVQGYAATSGFYALRLGNNTIVEQNGIGEEISLGGSYSAAIDYTSDVDIYRFWAEAGQTYLFDISTGVSDLFLDVENVYGNQVDRKVSLGSGIFTFDPLQSGYYSLHLSSNSFLATGAYSFSFTRLNTDPTYSISRASTAVDEGSTASFTLSTTNVAAGTAVAYTVSGVSSADVVGGALSGSVNVGSNGQATISIPIAADNLTEGTETLTVTSQGASASTTINDTSTTPAVPTYGVSATSASINEGSIATFTLSTTNVAAGTAVAYTVSGVSSADVVGGALSGSVNVGSNGQATISVPLAADNLTEGTETLTVTAQGKSASVAINDTSTGTTESDSSSIPQGNYTLNVIVDLFGQVLYLKGLSETVTSTSHTVEYAGTTFNWSEVDSLATTVTRDGNFTDEFAKEIADVYPSAAGIGYSTAVALVGASAIDSVLIAVAGADGNYVG